MGLESEAAEGRRYKGRKGVMSNTEFGHIVPPFSLSVCYLMCELSSTRGRNDRLTKCYHR